LEEREEGGLEETIKEEPEDEDEEGDEEGELLQGAQSRTSPRRPMNRSRTSMFGRLGAWGSRRKSFMPGAHETDLAEAAIPPTTRLAPRRSLSLSQHSQSASGMEESGSGVAKHTRRASDLDSNDEGGPSFVRRPSSASNSSHERDIFYPRRGKVQALGLVEMDLAELPDQADSDEGPVYVWTGTNDHATVMRIGFKKRISVIWLEAYALKQYVDLNLTAFEKILKK
jgi:phosphate transporter